MAENTDTTLDEAIERRVQRVSDERRILCSEALDLAAELGLDPAEVGRRVTELGIKVRRCQLGCF